MIHPRQPSRHRLPVRLLAPLLLLGACWLLAARLHPCFALAIVLPGLPFRRPLDSLFADELREWLDSDEDEDELEDALADAPIEEDGDIAAIGEYLARLLDPRLPVGEQRRLHRALPCVVDACLDLEGDAHYRPVAEWLFPLATALCDQCLRSRSLRIQESALILLEFLLAFNEPDAAVLLLRAVRLPLLPDDAQWSRVFAVLHEDHPLLDDICDDLADSLPTGFIAAAFLDAVNEIALVGGLERHPFSSDQGRDRLRDWYKGRAGADVSWARSATTALPFLARRYREELLPLARRHPHAGVRIEASWVAAVTGDENGIEELGQWALDPAWSRQACRYLEEMHRDDAIPAAANEPEFVAVSSLAAWLAEERQYGALPEEIAVFDQRILYWPPADDECTLFLVRYAVRVEGRLVSGVGFVGDLTYAFLDRPTDGMSAEDLYGLYCAWELDYNGSPEAPKEITAEVGRALLALYNPDFPDTP